MYEQNSDGARVARRVFGRVVYLVSGPLRGAGNIGRSGHKPTGEQFAEVGDEGRGGGKRYRRGHATRPLSAIRGMEIRRWYKYAFGRIDHQRHWRYSGAVLQVGPKIGPVCLLPQTRYH